MESLEYKIGGLDLDCSKLEQDCHPERANHKFVVNVEGNLASLFVAKEGGHAQVVKRFNLRSEQIAGGGSCYVNPKNQLTLDYLSFTYEAIPRVVARKFAKLMLPELEKLVVRVSGIAVDPEKRYVAYFWKQHGFNYKGDRIHRRKTG